MVGYKYRDLFFQTSIDKQLQISVDDGRNDITNEELAYENFELTESLCSEENLKFGVCESSQLKFRVLNNTDSLKNRIVTVKEMLNGNNDELFCYGSYKIETDTMTSDRKYRDVVAYDALHDVISENYIEWYNKLEFPVTIKDLRDSFAQEIGIEQADAELIFDGDPAGYEYYIGLFRCYSFAGNRRIKCMFCTHWQEWKTDMDYASGY